MIGIGESWQAKASSRALEDDVMTCSPDSENDCHVVATSSDDSENENQCEQSMTEHASTVLQQYSQDFGLTTSLEDYMQLGRFEFHSDTKATVCDSKKKGKLELIPNASLDTTSKKSNRRTNAKNQTSTTGEDSDGEVICLCHHCHLPRGDSCYKRDGNYLHGECLAQVIAHEACRKEEPLQHTDALKKQERRKEYHIGWNASKIPRNDGPASKLALKEVAQGMVCLVLQDESVRVASTVNPVAALNLEYLSTALQVRQREGHEPIFSLNPVDANQLHTMQAKVFTPEWLAGTSVGDVLFEADYYLKELSMGEYEQPALGMKSCKEQSDADSFRGEWKAREWFMVRKAEMQISEGDVLIPHVQMGVEAREQVLNSTGIGLEDAPLTRSNHPMVKYADQFSHFFDLIAERKSVIFHLRELAKASVVAKYLLDANVPLEESWFQLQCDRDIPCSLEVPQLWNEALESAIEVKDGKLMRDGKVIKEGNVPHMQKHGIYGGVAFGLDKFKLAAGMETTFASGIEGLRMRDFARSSDMRTRGPTGGLPGKRLQGVDLRLDQFDLSAPKKVILEARSASWCNTTMSLDSCAPIADAFWACLSDTSKAFREDDANLLRAIFNERMSDRRDEGEVFVPPDSSHSYVNKLRGLVKEEQNISQLRKDHFASKEFAMDAPGILFPRSWSLLSETSQLPERVPQGSLFEREDMKGSELSRICQSSPPIFERTTEDGVTFRIYRIGSIEVRTTQESGSKEYAEAVFSIRKLSLHSTCSQSVKDSESITKVMEFVESMQTRDSVQSVRAPPHYYIVLETETGGKVVTELMESGTLMWQENPVDLEDRNSLARVIRTTTCATPSLVQEIRTYKERMQQQLKSFASQSMRKQYARNVFSMASHRPYQQDTAYQRPHGDNQSMLGTRSLQTNRIHHVPIRSAPRRSPFKC